MTRPRYYIVHLFSFTALFLSVFSAAGQTGRGASYSFKQGCAHRSLETLMEYQVQQGILDKIPDIEGLFFPATLDV
jgi:hypothetical protein